MTASEFIEHVLDAATECGYGWTATGKHHPEDLAVALAPIMQAWAAGYAVGFRNGVRDDD